MFNFKFIAMKNKKLLKNNGLHNPDINACEQNFNDYYELFDDFLGETIAIFSRECDLIHFLGSIPLMMNTCDDYSRYSVFRHVNGADYGAVDAIGFYILIFFVVDKLDLKDCKFCCYNSDNGCPCDQSKCICCKDKSEFKKLKSFSNFQPFGEHYYKVKPLLSARVELALAMFSCSDPKVLNSLTNAYNSLTSYIVDL